MYFELTLVQCYDPLLISQDTGQSCNPFLVALESCYNIQQNSYENIRTTDPYSHFWWLNETVLNNMTDHHKIVNGWSICCYELSLSTKLHYCPMICCNLIVVCIVRMPFDIVCICLDIVCMQWTQPPLDLWKTQNQSSEGLLYLTLSLKDHVNWSSYNPTNL